MVLMRSGSAPVRCEKLERRDDAIGGFLGWRWCARRDSRRARASGWPSGAEADVVDGPAVDGDGSNAFRRGLRRLAQTFFKAGEDCVEGPVQRRAAMDRAVGNAMDQLRWRVVPSSSGAGKRGSFPRPDRWQFVHGSCIEAG